MAMHKVDDISDDDLEAMFQAARTTAAEPAPDGLMARVVADSEAELVPQPSVHRPQAWTSFLENFGGWPGLGGLVTATLVGLWVGFVLPSDTSETGLASFLMTEEDTLTLFLPDYDLDTEEG